MLQLNHIFQYLIFTFFMICTENSSFSIQESSYASKSELVPTGLPYRDINHEDFIPIRHIRLPLHAHAFSCILMHGLQSHTTILRS